MGRLILCPHCKSSINEDILNQRDNSELCPVCGSSLLEESTGPVCEKPCNFGEGIKLGEFDSFDEDKIDFWWYSIREPGEVWKGITFKDGDVSVNCAKCGHFAGATPYPIARTENYILLDPRWQHNCSHCGNELKNHILSKRPADWVDPRPQDRENEHDSFPKCPICGSTKIHKISMTNKAVSIITFGTLAAGHVSKTYKCDLCGAKF